MDKAFTTAAALLAAVFVLAIGTGDAGGEAEAPAERAQQAVNELSQQRS